MLGIGLYGSNGHQIQSLVAQADDVILLGHAALEDRARDEVLRLHPESIEHPSLAALLEDERIQLVSLCSPSRAAQADHAIQCLRAGKDVYAEKPCALREEDLDRILTASRETGRYFRQMSGSAFEAPYWKIRETVLSGILGEIVQVYAQKSYPDHAERPQDEAIDGGLLLQVGIHAARFITHCTGLSIRDIRAEETQAGMVNRGDLRSAVNLSVELDNGALALAAVNYANQRGFGSWGNETVRIWGTRGFVEAADAGARTRLVIGEKDYGPLDLSGENPEEFRVLLDRLLRKIPEPLTAEEELHPLRMLLRARANVKLVA